MVAISVIYQGELRSEATHIPSGATINTDAPKDNMGKGENFSPTDLVAAALGSCMLTIMGIAANSLNIDLQGTKVEVNKEMITAPERRIGKLAVKIFVPLSFNEEQKQKLQKAALTCPVHKSLHPDIAIPIEFIWG